jgi:hypothetical protein
VIPDVFDDVPRVDSHQGHHLRNIERSAAAEPDHCVGAKLTEGSCARHGLRRSGIARHSGVGFNRQAGTKRSTEFTQYGQRGDPLVGHDERPLDAALAQMRTDKS